MIWHFVSLMMLLVLPTNKAEYLRGVPGDIIYGEVSSETVDVIRINTQPCAKAVYETVTAPFHKTNLGPQTCPGKNGRTYMKVRVEQLASKTQTEKSKEGVKP